MKPINNDAIAKFFATNWKLLLSIFLFLGGSTWVTTQRDILLEVWNLPEERKRLEELSNSRYKFLYGEIELLHKKAKKQKYRIKQLEDKQEHIITGMGITTDCLAEELDIKLIWGCKVLSTNPRNKWIKGVDKYGIRTPLSLQKDLHNEQFYYTEIGEKNKKILKQ